MSKEEYLELFNKLKVYENKCKNDFPLHLGDYVEYEKREKTEERDAEWGQGIISSVFFEDEKGEAYAVVKDKASDKWVTFGDKRSFYQEDIGKRIREVKNPVSIEQVEKIQDELWNLESDKKLTREQYEDKKEKFQKQISQLQDKCIHKWQQGGFVKTIRTTFGGETDVYSYICMNCGMEKEE